MTTDQPTPGTAPQPPPARRTNPFAVIAASFAALAVGLATGIAIGTNLEDDDEPVTATSSSNDDKPATQATQPPKPKPTFTATPTPTGPEAFQLGTAGTYSEDGESVGTITVEAVETTADTPEYGEPPANGVYLIVTVSATALDGKLYDVNPFDFYVRDTAGNRWDQSSGNAYYVMGDNVLDSVTLNGGETIRGTISFDVPPEATQLVYAPFSRALGVWELTTA